MPSGRENPKKESKGHGAKKNEKVTPSTVKEGAASSRASQTSLSPPEARLATLRQKNKESSKRLYDRKQKEVAAIQDKVRENARYIHDLEVQVQNLERTLVDKRNARASGPSTSSKNPKKQEDNSGEHFEDSDFFGDPF